MTVNICKCTFLRFCLPLVSWILKVLFTDLHVRWNLHSEIALNEKKIKFSHDSKITVQVFNTLSSMFPQIITNLTKDTEWAFTERLERLYLIITLLIVLLSDILNESNLNFAVEFLMSVLSHFPNFIFPSEVLSYVIKYHLKVAFSKLGFCPMVSFLKVA